MAKKMMSTKVADADELVVKSVCMTADLIEAVEKKAVAEDRNWSDMIRILVRRGLSRAGRK